MGAACREPGRGEIPMRTVKATVRRIRLEKDKTKTENVAWGMLVLSVCICVSKTQAYPKCRISYHMEV
ncbi:MAG: hypothetical protein FD179_1484 [Erysipelotrichaceae bacterium]|nr:MAG: hypothetical protein FD179_1484 [Erysipelotrichaceae bacterium]